MIWLDVSDLERSNGRIEARRCAIKTRLEQQCQGCCYVSAWVLRDDIHQWLVDQGQANYILAFNQETRLYQVQLSCSRVAMLFKLTWV